jgi:hypothetical protein
MIGSLPDPGASPGSQSSFPDSEANSLAAGTFGVGGESREFADIAKRYTLLGSMHSPGNDGQ